MRGRACNWRARAPSPAWAADEGPLTRARCLSLQVVLLGMDILSALVTRLQDRFKAQIGTGELSPPPISAFTGSPHTLHLAVPTP